jgi:hypothetical protein
MRQSRPRRVRAAQNLRADAGYTRVLAVDVLAELPPWILFGEHGQAVADVLERAQRLANADACELAAERHPEAAAAYSRAWQRWLDRQPNRTRYRGFHSRLLAVAGAGRAGSPVGSGLLLTWTCVTDSARHAGSAAFTVDDEGDEQLLDPWAAAASALLDAAMALAHLTWPAPRTLPCSPEHGRSQPIHNYLICLPQLGRPQVTTRADNRRRSVSRMLSHPVSGLVVLGGNRIP